MTTAPTYKSKKATGCINMHYAVVTITDGVASFDEIRRLYDVEEINITDKYAEGENYADNKKNMYRKRVTGADIGVTLSHLLKYDEAALTGKNYQDGELETTTTDIQKSVALLYEKTYDDGSSDRIVYYNCGLSKDDNNIKTEGENFEFTGDTLAGKAIPLPNGKVKYEIASDEIGEKTEVKTKFDNFFKSVQFLGVADPTV